MSTKGKPQRNRRSPKLQRQRYQREQARVLSMKTLLEVKVVGCCKGGKLRYASEEEGLKALRYAQKKRELEGAGKIEKRVYWCSTKNGVPDWLACDGWHLTSREHWEKRS